MSENPLRSTDLQDIFFLDHSTKEYIIKFSPNSLSINSNDDSQTVKTIPIDDIYGCLCMKDEQNSIQCHLCLYLYTSKESKGLTGILTNKGTLRRLQQIITYEIFQDFERNFAQVMRWHKAITYAIYLNRNLPLDIVMTKRDKRVLVFANPASGAGKALRLVMEYVVGVWSEAEFTYQMIITEYAGHARNHVQNIQLNDWSGIVVASGDGLIFEVINGLMSRNDWQEALKIPIGHLPGGSGNAFITNIIRYSKQPIMDTMEKYIVQAAVLIATHNVIPFDLAIVDTCDNKRIFSFLCIEWGIIADVDCDSEQYRFLGEARFTVEAVKRILRPRIYNGYIDYIPYELDDNIVQRNEFSSNVDTAQLHQHLLPLNEPIPIDSSTTTTTKWSRINGPFAHVLITSKSSISKDVIAVPDSTLSDGYLTLQYIRTDGSIRMNLAKTFTKLSDGTHFDYDFVERKRIRAFRIVPNDTTGNVMVDGEKVAYGPIQGEILPSIGRCMGKYPKVNNQVSANP